VHKVLKHCDCGLRHVLLAVLLIGMLPTAVAYMATNSIIAIVPLGPPSETGDASAVAVDGRTGRVFAAGSGSTTSQISMLDAATGGLLQALTTGPAVDGSVESIDLDEARGRALVLTDPGTTGQGHGPPGRVSVLDARTGRVLRSTVVGPTPRPVALDERHGHFFVLTTDANGAGRIAMVDTVSGRVLRVSAIAAGAGNYQGPNGVALDGTRGRLFVSTVGLDDKGYVSVLDTRSGAVERTISLGAAIQGSGEMAADERAGRVFVSSGDHVLALNALDGRVLRSVSVATTVVGVVDDTRTGHVFVTAGRGVLMLDARSGALLRTTHSPGLPGGVLVDIGPAGRVFLTSTEDTGAILLTVLDAATGALVRTIDEGAQAGLVRVVDGRTGRVFLTGPGPYKDGRYTRGGVIVVRDARTGLIRQTIETGSKPMETVVNERTGAAFVLDSGEDTLTVFAPGFGAATPPSSPSKSAIFAQRPEKVKSA